MDGCQPIIVTDATTYAPSSAANAAVDWDPNNGYEAFPPGAYFWNFKYQISVANASPGMETLGNVPLTDPTAGNGTPFPDTTEGNLSDLAFTTPSNPNTYTIMCTITCENISNQPCGGVPGPLTLNIVVS